MDDEEESRRFLIILLKCAGYVTCEAKDGLEAIKQVQDHHPDLVLSDISMPNVDGIEMVRRLRQMPEGRQLSILVMSSYGMGKLTEAVVAGADHALPKPVNFTDLIQAVQYAVG